MIVTVEGADNVGKSTLSENIANIFNMRPIHFAAPKSKEDAMEQYFSTIRSLDPKQDYVMDRSWIGEWVYGPILRNYQPDYLEKLNGLLLSQEASKYTLNIMLYCPSTFMRNNLLHSMDEEDVRLTLRLTEIQNKFFKVFDLFYGRKVIFNIAHFDSLSLETKKIMDFVEDAFNDKATPYKPFREDLSLTMFDHDNRFVPIQDDFKPSTICSCAAWPSQLKYDYGKRYHETTFGTGNIKNPYLFFVGEAPGYKGCGKTGIPFYNDKSGMFLRQLLYEHNFSEANFYITNLLKCNPPENKFMVNAVDVCSQHLVRELSYIKPQNIIGVGRNAQIWLTNNGYINYPLRHPAACFWDGSFDAYKKEFAKMVKAFVREQRTIADFVS